VFNQGKSFDAMHILIPTKRAKLNQKSGFRGKYLLKVFSGILDTDNEMRLKMY